MNQILRAQQLHRIAPLSFSRRLTALPRERHHFGANPPLWSPRTGNDKPSQPESQIVPSNGDSEKGVIPQTIFSGSAADAVPDGGGRGWEPGAVSRSLIKTTHDDEPRDGNAKAERSTDTPGNVGGAELARTHYGRLQQSLRDCVDPTVDAASKSQLWLAYCVIREHHPDLLQSLSDQDWATLFACRADVGRQKVISRSLARLYEDMLAAGKTPSVSQKLVYIRILSAGRDVQESLRLWNQHAELTKIDEAALEYLLVGAKLYSTSGESLRALEIALQAYNISPLDGHSILRDIFAKHCSATYRDATGEVIWGKASHQAISHEIYMRSKAILGKNTSTVDRRIWFDGFTECGYSEDAFDVFTDMVKHRDLAAGYTRVSILRVLGTVKRLFSKITQPEEALKMMLDTLSILPEHYHVYLFQEWMATATASQDSELAVQILELMRGRGIMPDTTHLNTLLRALLRSGNSVYVAKAEEIGWRMVKQLQNEPSSRAEYVPSPLHSESLWKRRTERNVVSTREFPPADSDTIAALFSHHIETDQGEHVDYLVHKVGNVPLRRISSLMNMYIVRSKKQGDYDTAFREFRAWTSKGVVPDGATYRLLWGALLNAMLDKYTGTELPAPRAFLAESIRWWGHVQSLPTDANRFRIGFAGAEGLSAQKLIYNCFGLAKDLPGHLVALHVMQKVFGLPHHPQTAQSVSTAIRKHSFRNNKVVSAQRMGETAKQFDRIYHLLMERRFQRMGLSANDFAELDADQVADLNMDLLSEFLRVAMVRDHPPVEVEAMIGAAKKEMGVPDLQTGDMNAVDVCQIHSLSSQHETTRTVRANDRYQRGDTRRRI